MGETPAEAEIAAAEALRRRLAAQKGIARPDRRNTPLGAALKTFLKRSGTGWMLKHRDLLAAWYTVCGEEVAALTRVSAYRAGILTIDVYSPALRQELASFHKEALLEDLRDCLPGVAMRDIRFPLAPPPEEPAEEQDETENG